MITFGGQNCFAQTEPELKAKRKAVVSSKYVCLPEDIKPDTIVEVRRIQAGSPVGIRTLKETVVQRLDKINARCKGAKLIDRQGRPIYLYRLQGCWGNPPADYLEVLEKQKNDLQELKRKFTVIEITCDPSGETPF